MHQDGGGPLFHYTLTQNIDCIQTKGFEKACYVWVIDF